jgi:hypothetical protein
MSKCEKCNQEVSIGDWPWCPHGSAANFGEESIEPYWDEMLLPDPVYITSRAQRRAIMSRNGIEYRKKHESPPGSRVFIDMGRR